MDIDSAMIWVGTSIYFLSILGNVQRTVEGAAAGFLRAPFRGSRPGSGVDHANLSCVTGHCACFPKGKLAEQHPSGTAVNV